MAHPAEAPLPWYNPAMPASDSTPRPEAPSKAHLEPPAAPAPGDVVALVGPTGAGKTRVVMALAERLRFEVLSADSVQAIREFDLGSAKPTADERARVVHHGLDLVGPNERCTAWIFARHADAVLADARRRRMPLLATAGTGFYLQAWSAGLPDLPTLPAERSAALQAEARAQPIAAHARLAALDPASASRLHPHDWIRVARALAIIEASGAPVPRIEPTGPRLHYIGIRGEGRDFETGLRDRTRAMLTAGWIDEVRGLIARHGRDLPGLATIGYREILAFLEGAIAEAELEDAIVLATRRYARRQRIWFRAKAVRWFEPRDPALVEALEAALTAAMRVE